MDIWHRISFNASGKPKFFDVVKNLGLIKKTIVLPRKGGTMVYIDIKESDPHWEIIKEYVSSMGASDIKDTFFSDQEIRAAEWLRLISTFEQGYPQPKGTWPLEQSSYKIICLKCAIYNQIHPMRLAKEPHLGKKAFMSLIWASEVLCKPEVIQALRDISAKGYEDWDVIIHKTGKPSEVVRQLHIPGVASSGVIFDDDVIQKKCPICGTIKYFPHLIGIMYLKREALIQYSDFMLTDEWFGHGLLAWREILVSNRVATLILDNGWEGVRFKVVELV